VGLGADDPATSGSTRFASGLKPDCLRAVLSKLARRFCWCAASAVCGALLYLFLVGVLWVPAKRTLWLDVRSQTDSVLRIAPDVGRGFFEADATYRTLAPTTKRAATPLLAVDVPYPAKRIHLELTSRDSEAMLGAAHAVTKHGTRALDSVKPAGGRATALVVSVPALADEMPVSRHALVAAAGVSGSIALIVWGAAVRRRLRVGWRYFARPRVYCSAPGLLTIAVLFAALVLVVSSSADVYHLLIRSIDNPPYWPISIFEPAKPTTWSGLLAVAAFIAAIAALRLSHSASFRVIALVPIGLLILGVTNALHGWSTGYVQPTAGNQMYLADARSVSGVLDFLSGFTIAQPELRTHSRTHPPGAVLTYYALSTLTDDAGLMSLALGVVSFVATSLFIFAILRSRTDHAAALSTTLLFMLIPAVQIYFISSLDALICASFTATLFFFSSRETGRRYVGTIACMTIAMSLSFAAVWIWTLMFLYDTLVRRSVRTFLVVFGVVLVIQFLMYVFTGFNWLESFGLAARLENPHGFRLLSNPGTYFFTRLEGIAEIVLFASPLLLIVWRQSLERAGPQLRELAALSVLGVAVLALMLLSGAYKTGETARACLYIYPILVLPIAAIFEKTNGLTRGEQSVVISAVAAQAVTMQLLGDYYW